MVTTTLPAQAAASPDPGSRVFCWRGDSLAEPIDLLREIEELPGPVALVALDGDETGGDIERGGGHPVSAVSVLTTGISDHRVV